MANQNRVKAGKLANRKGLRFEQFLINSARICGFKPIPIPDGCETVRDRSGRLKLLRVQTPFDFILIGQNQSIFIDTKITQGKTFPHSAIKHHQLRYLEDCSEAGPSGYLVYFESTNEVVFFSSQKLASCTKGHSLKPLDGLILGGPQDWNPKKILEVYLSEEKTPLATTQPRGLQTKQ